MTTKIAAPGRPASASPRVALIVTGVGRSGTSALTRVLSLLGAALPAHVIGPNPTNPRGHWEPESLVNLNATILGLHGANWWSTEPIARAWFRGAEAARAQDAVAACIAAEYGAAPLLVIKDPRICRLVPLYVAALRSLGIAPKFVMPIRHPAEVVGSICGRDQANPRRAELMWVRHQLEAEFSTRSFPRVWTSYADLLADWRATAGRIGEALGVVWPNPPERIAADIEATLDRRLRHFDAGRDGLRAGTLALKLWMAAQSGVAGQEEAMRLVFDQIGLVVSELDRLGGGTDGTELWMPSGARPRFAAEYRQVGVAS